MPYGLRYLLAVCLLLSVYVGAEARPAQSYAFDCHSDAFATMDLYVFLETTTLHVFQTCTGGGAESPWLPPLPDSFGNVWWIWAFVDTSTLDGQEERYCEVQFSTSPAHGFCGDRIMYSVRIPDVD